MMKNATRLATLIPAAVLLSAALAAAGGDAIIVKGEVKAIKAKLTAGQVYQVTVEGKDFRPRVDVKPGSFPFTFTFGLGKPGVFQRYFFPKETREYQFFVTPETGGDIGAGPLTYELTAKPLTTKSLLKQEDKLVAADPVYKQPFGERKHHKAYPLKVEKGKVYFISMVHANPGFDPYLILEDAGKKQVASDDDGGGFPDALMIYPAMQDGDFRIIATGLGDALGGYTLTVLAADTPK
jgi:hypothetical protein